MSSTGLVRVTVTSATRRVDLALPSAVPVADLVPELARSVGLLDAATAHEGYRLVTPAGHILAADAGLLGQGVEDGGVITVAVGVDDPPPPVYDDDAEAVADAVEHDLEPWDAATGRRTALVAAVLLLLAGAAGLALQRGSGLATGAAVGVAAGLVLGSVALSRVCGDTGAAVTVACLGCAYAAVAGWLFGSPLGGAPFAAVGAGALAAGLVAALGLAEGRVLMLPPVVAGAVLLATGSATRTTSYHPAVLLTVVLVLVVLAGNVFPALAVAAVGAGGAPSDLMRDEGPVDLGRVRADVRVAHEILLALTATAALLLVLLASVAVSLGPAGALVAVLACVVVMLRARVHHSRAEVLTGLCGGVLGLLATAGAVLCLEPSWRLGAALALAGSGLAVLGTGLLRPGASVRAARLADLAETTALLALPPALVVATGVLTSVSTWVAGR